MNQRMTKRLRKTLLKKTPEVLMLLRENFGERTKQIGSEAAVWRQFKNLYKMGKVPPSLIMKTEKEKA